jgi:hypothetical protein
VDIFQKVKSITTAKLGLSEIVAHNFRQGIVNIDCKVGDSLNTLESINQKWDWIYIDPSRRNDAKSFMLKDCLPNVPDNLEYYFKNSDANTSKTAPLLDISAY